MAPPKIHCVRPKIHPRLNLWYLDIQMDWKSSGLKKGCDMWFIPYDLDGNPTRFCDKDSMAFKISRSSLTKDETPIEICNSWLAQEAIGDIPTGFLCRFTRANGKVHWGYQTARAYTREDIYRKEHKEEIAAKLTTLDKKRFLRYFGSPEALLGIRPWRSAVPAHSFSSPSCELRTLDVLCNGDNLSQNNGLYPNRRGNLKIVCLDYGPNSFYYGCESKKKLKWTHNEAPCARDRDYRGRTFSKLMMQLYEDMGWK